MATLHFKAKGAYKGDFWGCYSLEQALRLGQEKFDSSPNPNNWWWLYVTEKDRVVKDWLR